MIAVQAYCKTCYDPNCEECLNLFTNGCTKCKNGFQNIEGKCKCKVLNCIDCSDNFQYCNKCAKDYHLINGEECIINQCNITNCLSCLNSGICLVCEKDYLLKDDKCVKVCPDNCIDCRNETFCVICSADFYLIGETCYDQTSMIIIPILSTLFTVVIVAILVLYFLGYFRKLDSTTDEARDQNENNMNTNNMNTNNIISIKVENKVDEATLKIINKIVSVQRAKVKVTDVDLHLNSINKVKQEKLICRICQDDTKQLLNNYHDSCALKVCQECHFICLKNSRNCPHCRNKVY